VAVISLNGWQRLWVVPTVLWTLVVGVVAWASWPASKQYVSIFQSAGVDPTTGRMPTVEYYGALALLARQPALVPIGGVMPDRPKAQLPEGFVPDAPEAGDDVTALMHPPTTATGLMIEIPTVGPVRFPSSMSEGQIEAASKKLYEEHQNLVQDLNQRELLEVYARRYEAARVAAALALLPSAALYLFGWSVGWVRRGFKQSTLK
jgi:hypothetical protein